VKFHSDRIRDFNEPHRQLGWKNTDSQLLRFEALASMFHLDNTSVLDIGCGYADFKTFLDKTFSNVSYTGIDIMPAFIHEAARRFADSTSSHFICGDFCSVDFTPADYVFSCGGLSYRNSKANHPFSMIAKMWDTARKGIAFTMLDEEYFPKHPLLVPYSKDEILSFCRMLSRQVILKDSYLADDFIIAISK